VAPENGGAEVLGGVASALGLRAQMLAKGLTMKKIVARVETVMVAQTCEQVL
jgi:hypothetical protein